MFRKKTAPVLDGVDMEIHRNRVNGLTGPSGAGKSTLARLLLKLEGWDDGDILLRGRSIREIPNKDYYRHNRIMFQNPYSVVNPRFSVEKIITEPLRITGIDRDAINRRLGELLDLVGLPDSLLERRPHQVSGGQLQRAVLARTLSTEPEFIVLDEPFSSLDEGLARQLARDFKKIFRRLGLTVLLISHHRQRMRAMADSEARLEGGKIF